MVKILSIKMSGLLFYVQNTIASLRGCGNQILPTTWFNELPNAVKTKVAGARFGKFLNVIQKQGTAKIKRILRGLADRWWDTTHTFHFDEIGELTMTSTDFSAITGLPLCGKTLEYDMEAY